MPGSIPIHDDLEIPATDLSWSWARAGGAGGQHVNTSDTRARLHFSLSTCEVLTNPVKERLRSAHPSWVTNDGDIVLTSAENRSRLRNVESVEKRLADAIRAALTPPKRRKKTRPSRAAKRRRVESKKQRSEVKKTRKSPKRWD